jgi:hypothetical protein
MDIEYNDFKKRIKQVLDNKEALKHIGDLLGHTQSKGYRATRFLHGSMNRLIDWEYDETINYGEMRKVMRIFLYIIKITEPNKHPS